MIINTNIMAFGAFNNLQNTHMNLSDSLEQLSCGYRINKAADDVSGLVISSDLQTQISGLQQATWNSQNGISVVQTAEGALSSIQSMLQRVNQLVVESADTGATDSPANQAAQNEIVQLRNEIDEVATTTSFGNEQLLNGLFGAQEATIRNVTTRLAAGVTVAAAAGPDATAASYQAELHTDVSAHSAANADFTGSVTVNVADLTGGAWSVEFVRNSSASSASLSVKNLGTATAGEGMIRTASAPTTINNGGVYQGGSNVDAGDQIQLSIGDARITDRTDAAFTNVAGIDLTDTSSDASAEVFVNNALTEVSNDHGQLGAVQNRIQASVSNLQTTTENLQASDSSIVDSDMSLEMVNFTNDQILLQAGTAMLAQANAVPQTILKLLQ